ncbi:MAG: c-type cytochrome [Pseudomonadota bacterium]
MSPKSTSFARLVAVAAAASAFVLGAPAQAAGDAAKGEKLFKRCSTCHNVGPDAKNKVGPALTGIIGRTAGSKEDFTKYGPSLKALGESGFVWTEDDIFAYLENPRNFLRAKLDDPKARSKMAFMLRKEQDRRDVIAYLATFSTPAAPEAADTMDEASNAAEAATDVAEADAADAMEEARAAMSEAGEAMEQADAAMAKAEAAMQ